MLKTLRQSALSAASTTTFGAMLQMLDRVAGSPRSDTLAVLTYHRVDYAADTPELYPGLISATPEQFADQLDLVLEMGQVVSMADVLKACRGEAVLPPNSIAITFDDACRDFAEFAWPALQSRNLPATVFVPTAYPDAAERRFWWDRLHLAIWYGREQSITTPCGELDLSSDEQRTLAYRMIRDHVKQLEHQHAMQLVDDLCEQQAVDLPPPSVMSWDELRELAHQGVTLAPHTQTHPLLTQISLGDAQREIVGSYNDLKREIGEVLPIFAYPGGASNTEIAEIAKNAGIEIAFSVQRGINNISTADPLALNRINIGQSTNTQVLRAQLMAYWWKHRTRGD